MPDMVALCLEKGADIHETENLRTALEIALLGGCSKNGSIECVDLLIEAGAKDLEQAAMHAIHCGVPNMRDFILSKMQDRKFLIEIDEPVVCSSEETL
jgi:ankyrin repeat protein